MGREAGQGFVGTGPKRVLAGRGWSEANRIHRNWVGLCSPFTHLFIKMVAAKAAPSAFRSVWKVSHWRLSGCERRGPTRLADLGLGACVC